jgi:2-methylcitrate dehydratase
MENVLFKISYPAEFHAQTAVECAMTLHGAIKGRIGEIDKVVIETQEPGVRIIDKTGVLANPADRDHCIQYMVAIPLIFGRLSAADYEDDVASDPRVDALRAKMQVRENEKFTKEYYESDKRHIGNAVQVFFKDGTKSERIEVNFPVGHRKRREEGIPLLVRKFEESVAAHYPAAQAAKIVALFKDTAALDAMPVRDLQAALVSNA